LDEVLNGQSVMEHLSTFQIINEELESGGCNGPTAEDVPEDADQPLPVRGTGRLAAPLEDYV
jgi:hypothetical protein